MFTGYCFRCDVIFCNLPGIYQEFLSSYTHRAHKSVSRGSLQVWVVGSDVLSSGILRLAHSEGFSNVSKTLYQNA